MRETTREAKKELAKIQMKYIGTFYKQDDIKMHNRIYTIVKKTVYLYKAGQTEAYKKYFKYFYIWLINECKNNGYLEYLKATLYNYRYEPGELLHLLDNDAKIHNKMWEV